MNARVETLGREARLLTLEERLDLVDDILASLGDQTFPHDAAWSDEVADRVAAHERGEARTIPAAVIVTLLRQSDDAQCQWILRDS